LLLHEEELEKCALTIEVDFAYFDFDQEPERITAYTPKGILLINWHGVAKEIWVSSPMTGAHHFFYDGTDWKNTRNKNIFKEQIRKELEALK
jgi:frataxin-like iron-binding protein CyaY